MADRYKEIISSANDTYACHRFKEAALLYEQASRHAKEFQQLKDSFDAGVWAVVCWRYSGHSIRALDLLMELFQAVPSDADPFDFYLLKKHWFLTLLHSNPSLVTLNGHLNELEALTNENSVLPQGDIPSLRGQLLYEQGRFAEALEQAELAWAKYNDTGGYLKCGFADEAIRYNLKLSKIQSAKHWYDLLLMREREKKNHAMERRECRLLQCQAQFLFALWEQRYADTDIHVRKFEEELQVTQAVDWKRVCLEFRIRSLLLQPRHGDPLLHGHPARALLGTRSESERTVSARYERYLLLVDYRLAALRFTLGLEPVDDYFHMRKQGSSGTSRTAEYSTVQDRVFRVRRACDTALRQARYLDSCFQSNWRQREIQGRLDRMNETITAFAN